MKPQKYNVGDHVMWHGDEYEVTYAKYVYHHGEEGWEYLLDDMQLPIPEAELKPLKRDDAPKKKRK